VSTIFNTRRRPVLEALGQGLLLMSFIVAVLYGGGWYPASGIWPIVFKGSAVGLLAIFVLVNMQSLNHTLLFLALCASVAGDVLLEIPHEHSFTRGLTAFLCAHVIFILLYLKNRLRAEDVTSLRVKLAAFLWALVAISGFLLFPDLGEMMTPVLSYSAVLAAMATTALFSKFPVKLVAFGALLFVVSDGILGVQTFASAPDFTHYVIWATYYLAVLLMTLGVMLNDDRRTNYGVYRFD